MNIKKLNKQNYTSNNGITLIALVITIIVMLILVAVTISLSVNGGLFSYAGNAARETGLAKQDEQKLSKGQLEIDGKKYNSPEDYINGVEARIVYSEDLLDENGVLTQNAFYTDINNAIVEIPKGFKVSSNSLENTKAGGLVIQDEIGNEFVWIPVEDYTLFKRSEWSNNARSTDNISHTEPYKEAAQWEIDEYNNMIKSVQEHKGFYIGRYETGEKENGNVVVKRDKKQYLTRWGMDMTTMGTYGAVYDSHMLYENSDSVVSTLCYGIQWDAMLDFVKDSTHNVTSSSNWGNYLDTSPEIWVLTRTEAKYYMYNSSDEHWHWHNVTEDFVKPQGGYGIRLTTGAIDNFKAKNIYDIAGNISEWTMEASSTDVRTMRGGNYNDNTEGIYYSASWRGHYFASSGSYGFRIALYL